MAAEVAEVAEVVAVVRAEARAGSKERVTMAGKEAMAATEAVARSQEAGVDTAAAMKAGGKATAAPQLLPAALLLLPRRLLETGDEVGQAKAVVAPANRCVELVPCPERPHLEAPRRSR